MVNRKSIEQTIDNASNSFETCFYFLAQLKSIRSNYNPQQIAHGLINFQLLLSRSLYSVESKYRKVSFELKGLNKRRTLLTLSYFKKRSKILDIYLAALKRTIQIGKAIGDAYVWFFFQFDQNLLLKHINNEENLHPTHGSGGKAELLFLNRGLIIKQRYFTIYHGISNILRIGDFTIFDLKKFRINETVELKSKQINDRCYNMSLFTIGKNKTSFLTSKIEIKNNQPEIETEEVYKSRLEKQLKKMSELMKVQKTSKSKEKLICGENYIYDLDEELLKLKPYVTKHLKLGKGLIVSCNKVGNKSLSKQLLNGLKLKDPNIQDLYNLMDETMDGIKELDYKLFSTILYNEKSINFHPGTMPLFWYKINSSNLKKIYFGEIILTSVYNPARFIQALMEIGFKYKTENKSLIIYKEMGTQNLRIENHMYFVDLISMYLMKEKTIVRMFEETINKIKSKKVKNAKISLEIKTMMEL